MESENTFQKLWDTAKAVLRKNSYTTKCIHYAEKWHKSTVKSRRKGHPVPWLLKWLFSHGQLCSSNPGPSGLEDTLGVCACVSKS